MIRNSALIAVVALTISLIAHLLGVSLLTRVPPAPPPEEPSTGDVSLGNGFEDLAETASKPAEPEEAEAPDPPVEVTPEAPPVDIDTSLAMVEASNPEPSASPGTGPEETAPAETITPAEAEPSGAPEPQSPTQPANDQVQPQPVEAAASPSAETESEPLEPETPATAASQAAPSAPTEASPQEEIVGEPDTVPVETAGALPIVPSVDPNAIPVIVEETEAVDPAPTELAAVSVPEPELIEEVEGPEGGTELAVTESPRPPSRAARRSASALDLTDGSPPPILFPESPLVAYARDGNLSNWGGSSGSGSVGNANATNYAGQVLVHLNRVPSRRFGGRATARVLFEINPDGSLAWVDVISGTGTFEFNNAAMEQVRNAAPFPRPPAGAKRHFSFIYRSTR